MKLFQSCSVFILSFLFFLFSPFYSANSKTDTENNLLPFHESANNPNNHFSCTQFSPLQFHGEEKIILNKDPQSLSCLVKTSDEEIKITPESDSANFRSPHFPPRPPFSIFLKLVATITAPVVGEEPLGATNVVWQGRYAVVTYNTKGDRYLGALQIVDLINPRNPALVFQLLLRDKELNTALIENSSLYLAGAESQDVTNFPTPAEIQKVALDAMFLPINFLPPVALPSYTATDLVSLNDSLYVTTGNTGGLVRLDKSTLTQNAFIPLPDARSVAVDETDDKLYVFQGTPGRMTVVNPSDLSYQTYFVGGATIPEAKGSITISDDFVFIGAGDGGALIVSKTGEVLGRIPNPDDPRLLPEKRVTNAVTGNHRILMIANGEAGVRIAYYWAEGIRIRSVVIGKMNFGDYFGAVNGVNLKGKYLLVAAGLGGLKIVEVKVTPPLPKKIPLELE